MRKVFIVLASLSSITALVLTYLPMGTIALIPVALAVVFSLLAMTREKEKSQVFPKVLFFLSVVIEAQTAVAHFCRVFKTAQNHHAAASWGEALYLRHHPLEGFLPR